MIGGRRIYRQTYIDREGFQTIPRKVAGADVSPLDVFASPYLKNKLKGHYIDTSPS